MVCQACCGQAGGHSSSTPAAPAYRSRTPGPWMATKPCEPPSAGRRPFGCSRSALALPPGILSNPGRVLAQCVCGCLAYASCQRSCMREYHPKRRGPSTPLPARMAGRSRLPWPNCCRGGCRRRASPARSQSFRSAYNERSWRLLGRMLSCTKPSWHWRASSSARETVSRGVPVSCQPQCGRHKKDRRGSPSGDVSCVLGSGPIWECHLLRQVPWWAPLEAVRTGLFRCWAHRALSRQCAGG
jgi:hypothetical protein